MARCVALIRGAPGTEAELQVAGVVRFEQVGGLGFLAVGWDGVGVGFVRSRWGWSLDR